MSQLARMERQAVLLGDPARHGERRRARGYTPITDVDLTRDGAQIIGGIERAPLHIREQLARARELAGSPFEPRALVGGLTGLVTGAQVPTATLAAVTGVTVNTALWKGLSYTPLPALLAAPTQFSLDASGIVTSSAAAQTIIWNPGLSTTGTAGTGLTSSGALTLGSTITNAVWFLEADLTVRTAGPSTDASIVGNFKFQYTTVANAGTPTSYLWRSTAAQTFDSTLLQSLVMGVTPSAIGVSVAAEQIRWGSWG